MRDEMNEDYKYEETFEEWVNFVASEKEEEEREARKVKIKRIAKGVILWVSFFVVLMFISIFDSLWENNFLLAIVGFVGVMFIIIFNMWLVGSIEEAERLMCVKFFNRLCGFKGEEHDTKI